MTRLRRRVVGSFRVVLVVDPTLAWIQVWWWDPFGAAVFAFPGFKVEPARPDLDHLRRAGNWEPAARTCCRGGRDERRRLVRVGGPGGAAPSDVTSLRVNVGDRAYRRRFAGAQAHLQPLAFWALCPAGVLWKSATKSGARSQKVLNPRRCHGSNEPVGCWARWRWSIAVRALRVPRPDDPRGRHGRIGRGGLFRRTTIAAAAPSRARWPGGAYAVAASPHRWEPRPRRSWPGASARARSASHGCPSRRELRGAVLGRWLAFPGRRWAGRHARRVRYRRERAPPPQVPGRIVRPAAGPSCVRGRMAGRDRDKPSPACRQPKHRRRECGCHS